MNPEISLWIILVLILLGFWFSIIGIYDGDKRSQTNSQPFLSPQIFNGTFNLVKQIDVKSFWHWKYETTVYNDDYELIQACPTFKHDVYLKRNGILQMRSDGKIGSTESVINIYNNHGDFIYKITTGNFWITVLNQNKILVNFHLEDPFGNTILYVESVNYWNIDKSFTFKDINGNVVASASKDITTFPWTWKAYVPSPQLNSSNSSGGVRDNTSPDIGLLMMIFAQSSFSEVNMDGKYQTDVCNNYFFYVCIIDGILTGCLLIALVLRFKKYIKELYFKIKNRNIIKSKETQLSKPLGVVTV